MVAEQPAKHSVQGMPKVAEVAFVKHPLVCGTAPRAFAAHSENTKTVMYLMAGCQACVWLDKVWKSETFLSTLNDGCVLLYCLRLCVIVADFPVAKIHLSVAEAGIFLFALNA